MPNPHAVLRSTIWDDADYLDLGPVLRDLFTFMISQDDLLKNGVIAIRLNRWALKLRYDRAELVALLEKLAAARFVVIDWAYEELLVRTYIRNDEVYRQPNQLKAARAGLASVSSMELKASILVECERIARDCDDIPNGSVKVLADMIDDLKRTLTTSAERMSTTSPEKGITEGFPEGFQEPQGEPLPEGSGVGVGVGVELKVRTTTSSTAGEAPAEAPKKTTVKKTRAKRIATRVPDDFHITEAMATWGRRECPNIRNPQRLTEEFVDYWRQRDDKDAEKRDWVAAWRNRMRYVNDHGGDAAPRNGYAAPPPARVLAADDTDRCTVRFHESEPARTCGLCRAEAKGTTNDD